MKPVRCISSAGEFGDCYRACIASILELPPEQVPHFGALSTDSEQMKVHFRQWLGERLHGDRYQLHRDKQPSPLRSKSDVNC